MKKIIKITILFMVMGFLNPNSSYLAAQDDTYLSFGYTYSSFSVSKMAASFRTVPVHKDDLAWGDNAGTISREAYKFNNFWGLEFGWQKELKNNLVVGLGIIIGGGCDDQGRNYTFNPGTDQRGYGAALTFSGIGIEGPLTLLGLKPVYPFALVPKASLDIPLNNKKYRSIIGLSASYELLEAVNGWDRYNSHEANSTCVLAHVIPLSISFRFSGYEIGAQYLLNFKTNNGLAYGTEISQFGFFLAINSRALIDGY